MSEQSELRDPAIIGIPYGTRLLSVVLVGGETHLWTAVKCRGPYEKWQGTYLRIENNGRVTRVTKDDAYTVDDEFVIKENGR
jgi:hypothetical protein